MKTVTKVLSVLLALALVVGCFAACGSDTAGDTTTAPASGSASALVKVIDVELTEEYYAFGVDKNQPELLEQVNAFIAEIKANGQLEEIFNKYFGDGTPTAVTSAALDESKDQLVVATNAEFPPFEYTEGTNYLGVDMEIAVLLAQELGKELVIQNMDFDAVCLSVGTQRCDIAMAGLTISEEREEVVTFSESYYQASQKLIVPADDTTFDNCTTADEVLEILRGFDSSVRIGYQTGTTGQKYVQSTDDYEYTALNVTPVDNQSGALAVQAMVNGNLDYVVIDAAPAQAIADSVNGVA